MRLAKTVRTRRRKENEMRKRLIAFGACLLMLLCGCSKAAPEVGVQINGADMDFVPSVFEVSANKDGSYLDGTSASKLPCLLVAD